MYILNANFDMRTVTDRCGITRLLQKHVQEDDDCIGNSSKLGMKSMAREIGMAVLLTSRANVIPNVTVFFDAVCNALFLRCIDEPRWFLTEDPIHFYPV